LYQGADAPPCRYGDHHPDAVRERPAIIDFDNVFENAIILPHFEFS
jgi:hypothetical protein